MPVAARAAGASAIVSAMDPESRAAMPARAAAIEEGKASMVRWVCRMLREAHRAPAATVRSTRLRRSTDCERRTAVVRFEPAQASVKEDTPATLITPFGGGRRSLT